MKLLVSALEPSSNLHLRSLLNHLDDVTLTGNFDGNIDAKCKPLIDSKNLSKMGFLGIIGALPRFYSTLSKMTDLAKEADKVLLIDGSGFNLPLAQKIKATYPNKEILYYILPQVWASRPSRIPKLLQSCDHLLGILPFETLLYNSPKARYVGHPLLDQIKVQRIEHHTKGTIAFLPGSRKAEIKQLMPIFYRLRRTFGNAIRPLLVIPRHFARQDIARLYPNNREFEIVRDTHEALSRSEYAFICSGTATLEAALIGTPFTLAYRAKKIDMLIAQKLLGVKRIGLANILAEHIGIEKLHDELIQDDVSVENLLRSYEKCDRAFFSNASQRLKEYLKHGSAKTVASILKGA